jgi:hypothetical protein
VAHFAAPMTDEPSGSSVVSFWPRPLRYFNLAIRPAAAPLWAEVVARRTRTMDCKWVAKPTGTAPPSRATSLCDPCDQTVSFDHGWSNNTCVCDSRKTDNKTDNKCCAQNY